MKKHSASFLAALLPPSVAILATVFLTGCNTPNEASRRPDVEYYHGEESTTPKSRQDVANNNNTAARTHAQEHPTRQTAVTTSANPPVQSGKPKKTEAEVRDASELQIDPETRQRMGSNPPAADVDKKTSPKKTEAEVRDASDLQIDDQTKKQMDKPN